MIWKRKIALTHWGRVTHICVSKITIIGSDNGLPPGRRQAIIWTNAGILLIGPCGTKFHEILIESQTFSFKKMHFKMSSGKWRPFCLGLNVLTSSMVSKIYTPYCWNNIYTHISPSHTTYRVSLRVSFYQPLNYLFQDFMGWQSFHVMKSSRFVKIKPVWLIFFSIILWHHKKTYSALSLQFANFLQNAYNKYPTFYIQHLKI